VHLSELRIRDFRNLGSQDLEIPPEGLALIGDNAQGKSNFLEAVYYLETFRSFRGASDERLVALGEEMFRLVGTVTAADQDVRTVAAAYQRRGKRKKVTVNGSELGRLGDALGNLAAVLFSPGDVVLVSGGPAERRRFLDIVLSLNVPGYLRALQHFRHVLSQRNTALKDESPPKLVRVWDEGLVHWGTLVLLARRAWIEERCGTFRALYEAVAGAGQSASLRYSPGVPLEGRVSEKDVAAAYLQAIESSWERDVRARSTVMGPHRDDLEVTLGESSGGPLDARGFGSGGQWRTAALALRLVEARTIRDRRGQSPLVLVDDVFAELDEGRSERALELLEREETGQVILTAPKASDVRFRGDVLPRWHIVAGKITA
jgi:DNA replication and repair protein RecF